jgi:hypothetical protein
VVGPKGKKRGKLTQTCQTIGLSAKYYRVCLFNLRVRFAVTMRANTFWPCHTFTWTGLSYLLVEDCG